MSASTDHIVLEAKSSSQKKSFLCRHCGRRDPLSLPVTLHQFQILSSDFIKRHRHCKNLPAIPSKP